VSVKGPIHREPTRGRETQKTGVSVEEQLPASTTEFLPSKELIDLELPLCVGNGLTNGTQESAALGS
jgi:hypothetical protein